MVFKRLQITSVNCLKLASHREYELPESKKFEKCQVNTKPVSLLVTHSKYNVLLKAFWIQSIWV